MEGILFLIGINELDSYPETTYSKEQKQDLMHIAVCTLLSKKGIYNFIGRDGDGWPHFEAVETIATAGLKSQERLLRECIIEYFAQ